MEKVQITTKIINLIEKNFDVEISHPLTKLDHFCDPFDIIELILQIEIMFDIEFNNEITEKWEAVSDIINDTIKLIYAKYNVKS